jgi:hypothetical protein
VIPGSIDHFHQKEPPTPTNWIGERQPDGEECVDGGLDVEVDLVPAEQRDVDEIGQRPQPVLEDHQ